MEEEGCYILKVLLVWPFGVCCVSGVWSSGCSRLKLVSKSLVSDLTFILLYEATIVIKSAQLSLPVSVTVHVTQLAPFFSLFKFLLTKTKTIPPPHLTPNVIYEISCHDWNLKFFIFYGFWQGGHFQNFIFSLLRHKCKIGSHRIFVLVHRT